MKINEALKESTSRHVRDLDVIVIDHGASVNIPAWQFALFVNKFEEYRVNQYAWMALFLVLVFVWLFTTVV